MPEESDPRGAGPVLATGVEALVQSFLDELRSGDAGGGARGGYVTGYPGSPFAELDLECTRRADELRAVGARFEPGLNEDLAVTALHGTQLAPQLPGATVDGVVGLWFGKGPGLDRSVDALRHANHMGSHPRGGVVVAVGDDPGARSSSLPTASEPLLADLGCPVLVAADPAQVWSLARAGWAISRRSGLWVGLKVATDVADGVQTFTPAAVPSLRGADDRVVEARVLGPVGSRLEREVLGERRRAALEAARALEVNLLHGPADARHGIVVAGAATLAVRRALQRRGAEDLVKVLQLGLVWPLDEPLVDGFVRGLDAVLVVEEKRPFVEPSLRALLDGRPDAPRIVGARDLGDEVLPPWGERTASQVAAAIDVLLGATSERPSRRPARSAPGAVRPSPSRLEVRAEAPGPRFCAGCPHGVSARSAGGSLLGAGVGCHGMVLFDDGAGERGVVTGLTQMGGEGAQWIGALAFLEGSPATQLMGDGTFAHSGSLAVRAVVAAGVDLTFKILVNSTVAMTGGQDVHGGGDARTIVQRLLAEGVPRVVAVTDDVDALRDSLRGLDVPVRPRRELDRVEGELAAVPGPSAIVYVQPCSLQRERERRDGLEPEATRAVHILSTLCDGCGDCVSRSGCTALHRSDDARRVVIDAASCVDDEMCLDGRCPSFVTVAASRVRHGAPQPPPRPGPSTVADVDRCRIRVVGRGGQGVVTVARVLAAAAHRDGLDVRGVYHTGLARKGGSVACDLIVGRGPIDEPGRLDEEACDLYVSLDQDVGAAAALSSVVVPGHTVRVAAGAPPASRPEAAPQQIWVDARRVAEATCGSPRYANTVVLGAISEAGLLPVGDVAVEAAIADAGVEVDANLAAFRHGRLARRASATSEVPGAVAPAAEVGAGEPADDPVARIGHLAERLRESHGARAARRFSEAVGRLHASELQRLGCSDGLAAVAAEHLARLMARRDAYEVARILLSEETRAELLDRFGDGVDPVHHLAPPWGPWRSGRRKLRVGARWTIVLRALRRGAPLRDTWLDPLRARGTAPADRMVVEEYLGLIARVADELEPDTVEWCRALLESAGLVRGYGDVRMERIAAFRERSKELSTHPAREVDRSVS